MKLRLPTVLVFLAFLATSCLVGCGSEPPLNVLIVTLDTTRADRLGCYGQENAGTPNLDQLAAEGFLFERAYTTVPITLPSHSTLFTGRYPLAHGVRDNGLFRLPDSETTLAERLRDLGYATAAGVGSFPLTRQFGIDQGFELFDDHITVNVEDFRGRRVEPKRGVYFDERTSAQVNDVVLPWLRERIDRPFFAWLHYWDPHQPLIPPAPFNQLYLHDLYQGEIAFADQSLGSVLRTLREAGVYDRTLIVIVGDHGEGLGEHKEESHSMLNYNSTLRVPLIVKVPGFSGGQRISRRVGTVDVLPTLLELLGLPADPQVQGRSLVPWMQNPGATPEAREPHYAETLSPRLSHGWGELRTLYDGPLKYVHGPRPELYDVSQDPDELHDLGAERPEDMARMRQTLESFLDSRASSSAGDAAQEVDPETRQRLAALGYLSGDGASPDQVVEELQEGGVAPQDRVRDVNLMSQSKQFIDRGDFLNASDLARRLIELDPGNAYYRGLLATALLGLGKIEEAAEVVEEATSLAAQNSAAFLGVAQRLFLTGHRDRGLALARRVTEEHESAYGRYLLGEMTRALDDPRTAEVELRAALEIEPGFQKAALTLGVFLAESGRYEEAGEVFEDLIQNHPLDERGHFNYAVLLLQTNRWDRALEHLDRSVQLAPNYWQAHLARLAVFVDRDQSEQAQQALRHLETHCRDPQILARARDLIKAIGTP